MRDIHTGVISEELKPALRLRKYLKLRDEKAYDNSPQKTPSEVRSEAMRKRFENRGRGH